ncbi:MAG: hypothetical protein RIQ53_2053 [Pseudomonadota bacterium]
MRRARKAWVDGRPAAGLLVVLACAALAGCGADQEELQAWMDQQRREVKPSVEPLEPPKKFSPEPYDGALSVDPFNPQKMEVALKQETRQTSALLAAEQRRRREPLEAFPLDGMSMVGSLRSRGGPVALLRVDGLLYQVKPGDYIGQNFGKVVRVGETELELREVVQDAAGEWVERRSTLQLQEQGQEKVR